MRLYVVLGICLLCLWHGEAFAEDVGTASGKGLIEQFSGENSESSMKEFHPKYSFAYRDRNGSVWVVLTEKEPPIGSWKGVADQDGARASWCGESHSSFVALKLDKEWKVDLYFHCPGDGAVSTEMLSTMNGLDSILVIFESRTEKKLKGSLRTGTGSCPGPGETAVYCTETGEYLFDAPVDVL